MAKYRLSRAAERDLQAIGRYTRRQWGAGQAATYLRRLDLRMESLVDHPGLGMARHDVREGYRCAREGRHLIFYRKVPGTIEIIRILHERMDVVRRLTDENEG